MPVPGMSGCCTSSMWTARLRDRSFVWTEGLVFTKMVPGR